MMKFLYNVDYYGNMFLVGVVMVLVNVFDILIGLVLLIVFGGGLVYGLVLIKK